MEVVSVPHTVRTAITREQYGEWKNHPATLFFRKFLKDRMEALIHRSTADWLNSAHIAEVNRGRILELMEVQDVPFEAIEIFYQEQERENAAEGAEAVSR